MVLIAFILLVTLLRFRQNGTSWRRIFAFPSQLLHFVLFGGVWGHTLCSCVGLRARDGSGQTRLWGVIQKVLDSIFWIYEPDHCAQSLWRLEKGKK